LTQLRSNAPLQTDDVRLTQTSRPRRSPVAAIHLLGLVCLLTTALAAQAPGRGPAPQSKTGGAPSRARGQAVRTQANLIQLMRGVMYPASNVIFAAQDDLGKQPPVPDPSVSPNPLTTTYGGWQAVENAALALYETAGLIAVPRVCSNGRPAPVQRADWLKDIDGLRAAGLAAYKAAQKKDMDAMVDAGGMVSDACAACHDVYREKKNGNQDRCLP
jgi:hypothetical protein